MNSNGTHLGVDDVAAMEKEMRSEAKNVADLIARLPRCSYASTREIFVQRPYVL